MKNKRSHLKFIFILVLILILVPKNTYASRNYEVTASSCSGGVSDDVINMGINSYGICEYDNSSEANDGIFSCAEESLGLWFSGIHIPSNQTGKTALGYIYDVIRIDTWGNSSRSWNTNNAFGTATCPNMSLSFKREQNLDNSDISGLVNAKIKDISIIDWNDDNNLSFLGSENKRILTTYGVKNLQVQSLSDNRQLTNENGGIITSTINFKINISNLITYTPNGLGYNGTNNYLCNLNSNRICTTNPRALHYLIPVKITIEYDNEVYEPDPCNETVDGMTSDQYAYQNPGVCCNEYPETCCDSVEYIQSIKNSRPDVYNFCCTDTGSADGRTYYGTSASKGLPPLGTFKHYFFSEYYTKFYSSDPTIGGVCATCNNEDAYYTYEEDGEIKQSSCCQNGQYKDIYSETKCKVSTCSTTNNQCSSSDEYFYENKDCCCSINNSDDRCAEDIWKETGLSCIESPTNINAPFGTNTVASGSKSVSGGRIYENITFTDYPTLTQMKSNIVKAGTGFDYDITVRHQLKKSAKTYYDFYSECTTASCAQNKAIHAINSFVTITSDEHNAINSVKSKYLLATDSKTEPYIPDSALQGGNNPLKTNRLITATYKHCYACINPNGCCSVRATMFGYPAEYTYTYNYDLTLREQFIAKQDASLAVRYNQVTEYDPDDIKTVPSTSLEDDDNLTEYLYGGNKFYTETTTSTGIYDFTVKLADSSSLGATRNLTNYNGGFDCQYGVVNQLRKNGSFDCGTNNNLPCPDNNGSEGNNKNGRGFYFRQISLFDPFPNGRLPGSNWRGNVMSDTNYIGNSKVNAYITGNNDDVYTEEPMYEVKLDADLINQIKNYNKNNGYDYGWKNMTNYAWDKADATSNFLNMTGSINWNNKLDTINNAERQNKVGDFE